MSANPAVASHSGVVRTVRSLADGREIVYYDRAPGHARTAEDRRRLDDAPAHTELRHDPLLDQWVVVAGHRQSRTFLPPSSECPLCPTRGDQLTEVPEPDYEVVVFENRFPSLTLTPDADAPVSPDTRHGLGRCEVVCFTSDHATTLAHVDADRMRLVLEAWIDREGVLSQIPGIEYVFAFENRGIEIGVTLSHPHGQIYAYPFVPPIPARELANQRAYFEARGRGLLADLLAAELAAGERVIYAGERAAAIVPVCARYAYEVWVAPIEPVPSFMSLDAAARADLARALKTVLMKFDRLWQRPFPYLMVCHQAPTDGREHPYAHLRIDFYPPYRMPGRLKYLAGTEIGAGVFTADTLPEHKAAELRAVEVAIDD